MFIITIILVTIMIISKIILLINFARTVACAGILPKSANVVTAATTLIFIMEPLLPLL